MLLIVQGNTVGQIPNYAGNVHVNMGYEHGLQMSSRTSSAGTGGSIGSQMGYDNHDLQFQRAYSEDFQTSEGFRESYEIGETLGKGSFAVVKEAQHKQSGERFAIKMIDRNNPGVCRVCTMPFLELFYIYQHCHGYRHRS